MLHTAKRTILPALLMGVLGVVATGVYAQDSIATKSASTAKRGNQAHSKAPAGPLVSATTRVRSSGKKGSEKSVAKKVGTVAHPAHSSSSSVQSTLSAAQTKVPLDAESAERARQLVAPINDRLDASWKYFAEENFILAELRAEDAILMVNKLVPTGTYEPHRGIAQQVIACIRMEQGNYAEALRRLLAAKPQEDWDDRYAVDVALCYVRLGDFDAARQVYKNQHLWYNRHQRVEGDLPPTTSNQGLAASILLSRGIIARLEYRPRQAVSSLLAAQQAMPVNPYLAFVVAEELHEAKRDNEAVPFYQLAVERGRGEYAEQAKSRIVSVGFTREIAKQRQQAISTDRQTTP